MEKKDEKTKSKNKNKLNKETKYYNSKIEELEKNVKEIQKRRKKGQEEKFEDFYHSKVEKKLSTQEKKDILLYSVIAVIAIIILIVVIAMSLRKITENDIANQESPESQKVRGANLDTLKENDVIANRVPKLSETFKTDYIDLANKQLAKPERGDDVLEIIFNDMSSIKFKLFRPYTQNAYYDLIKAIEKKYYSGQNIKKYNEDSLIIGPGDDSGDIWSTHQKRQVHQNLVPYYGALVMKTNNKVSRPHGSDFRIITKKADAFNDEEFKKVNFPEKLKTAIQSHGGTAITDYMEVAVIGQMFEGEETLEKITKSKEGEYTIKEMTVYKQK